MQSESTIALTAGQGEEASEERPRDLRKELARAFRKCTPAQRIWLRVIPDHKFQPWGAAYALKLSKHTIWKWLRDANVKRVRDLQDEIATEDYDITHRRVLCEYSRLAFSDIRQAFDGTGKLKPPSEWPDELAAAVAGVDTQEHRIRGDDGKFIDEFELVRKLKVHDKKSALEFLANFKGMVGARKIELTGKNGSPLAAPTIYIGGPGEPGEPDGTDAG